MSSTHDSVCSPVHLTRHAPAWLVCLLLASGACSQAVGPTTGDAATMTGGDSGRGPGSNPGDDPGADVVSQPGSGADAGVVAQPGSGHDPALLGRWSATISAPPGSTDYPSISVEVDLNTDGSYAVTQISTNPASSTFQAGCASTTVESGGSWTTSAGASGGLLDLSAPGQATQSAPHCADPTEDQPPSTMTGGAMALFSGAAYTVTATTLTMMVTMGSVSQILTLQRIG